MVVLTVHVLSSALLPGAPVLKQIISPTPIHRHYLTAASMAEPRDDLSMVAKVRANMNEGELSTRGEAWSVSQAVLLLLVVFAPAQPVAPAVEAVVGLAAIATAVALSSTAVSDLTIVNLTPWPKPVEKNELKTVGVYSLCRHPMYTSLITGSFGLSLVTLSFERLLLTIALFMLLSFKAGREEQWLDKKHGEAYRAYASSVPQFFPSVRGIQEFMSHLV